MLSVAFRAYQDVSRGVSKERPKSCQGRSRVAPEGLERFRGALAVFSGIQGVSEMFLKRFRGVSDDLRGSQSVPRLFIIFQGRPRECLRSLKVSHRVQEVVFCTTR